MCLFDDDALDWEPLQLLDSVSPPIQVVRGYVRDEQTTLEIRKKIMMIEETSVVMDGRRRPVATIKGNAFWFNTFKAIYDADGTVLLFKMRYDWPSFQRRFSCEDEQGRELFRIKRKFKWCGIKLIATIPSTVGDLTLQLTDVDCGHAAKIKDLRSGAVVATISYALWRSDLVLQNREAYTVNVAGGVDLSVIVALCLAWDQAKEDNRQE
ncbi:hypothetical protein CcaverHIS002_0207100 [Cutaneotrichosporon cavernicola]|uniref:DUF567-domain-containing protein n=1 Tax=Cutaneotrichosporon cavernicola TaxID=279322 RepID=A0AA48L1Q4_9TREE|nr:uncharacterized protein CcaverHIS019_0207090 [Cutaneotrichosporon cavernicola]BEI81550.1 hypothetical protein CcaverHIS002_0207100 [Cutaneotrichosporon cavernicola]BEI89347.1 hypothetical protein CcaverHIS019_0207090 [Cutaneotrichosporon cavernicola]BEI97122.1 hypothetical protein CcaverHIS631_0207110 [Cutaneotrichosporon cavernicola]BEJ04895.1 hypothetical protein CcaverHIS641_0207120 [Cutaneotrichosporon cavernicola]